MTRVSLRCTTRFLVALMVVAWFFLSVMLSQLPVYVESMRGTLVDIRPMMPNHLVPPARVLSPVSSVITPPASKLPPPEGSARPSADDAWWFYRTPFNLSVWDTSSGQDRILEQLAYAKSMARVISNTTRHKVILVHPAAGGLDVFKECPVKQCTLSHNSVDARIADAIVYANTNSFPGFIKKPNQIWIYYHLESPMNTPSIPSNVWSKINWTATYRTDSTLVTPYEKFVPYDPAVRFLNQNRSYAAGKTKMVAWFVSNCKASNNRLQYANEVGKYVQVDIYGRCGPLKCPRKSANCFALLNRDYKFYFAFENSNCIDYITEKFYWNGLLNNVVPIVMGARLEDYRKVAPPHSFIHVDEFATPQDLAKYLTMLSKNDTLYNEYFHWKNTGSFINTKFWCRLCAMVHGASSAPASWYPNIEMWWHQDVCRSVPWGEVQQVQKA